MKRASNLSNYGAKGLAGVSRAANIARDEDASVGIPHAVLLACVLGLAALAYVSISGVLRKSTPKPDILEPANSEAPQTQRHVAAKRTVATPPVAAPNVPAAPLAPVTPETRQLVEALVTPETTNGVLVPAQAGIWKTNLAQLVQHGAAAIPAIREFLDKNIDLDFGVAGRQMLGYDSACLAMLDALAQIGGPEALGAIIAALAKNFEQLEPAVHRPELLEAARQALAMAGQGQLAGTDVAPLFEVFQNCGDASVSAELRKNAEKWNYYSMVALAQLPEGVGIPELVSIVQGEGSSSSAARTPALEMLAQAAAQSETARNALLEQAKQNALTPYNWATLQLILAGDRVGYRNSGYDPALAGLNLNEMTASHISSGNQNFFTAPPAGGLTAEQANAQSALIDQLRAVTTDPAGLQVLERARQMLAHRSAQIVKTAPNP
ncbi:MAG: hypothetical protein NT154_11545 [Verrucomicrobia bacterium]|nr:hypothetical protein [Verrucomicrobiota bacterium]